MSVQTLEELKRENAESESNEAEEAKEDQEDQPEAIEAEFEEVEAEEEPQEEAEEVEAESSEPESEAWMQSDEQQSENNGQAVPVKKHVSVRNKLKGEIKERDSQIESQNSEIEKLKAEIAELKGAPQPETLEAMPKLEDFNYDEAKYQAAVNKWIDTKIDRRNASSAQSEKETQAKEKIDLAVNDHYERAAGLIAGTSVTEDMYKTADRHVRQTFEEIFPKGGDQVVDQVIAFLGEGSEKVIYRLGINSNDMSELKQSLRDDPSGSKAMLYLGGLKTKLTSATQFKNKSEAPKPGTKLQGGDTGEKGSYYKRAVRAARSKNDVQKVIDLKREAKAKGVDTKDF